jgi:hypothetical protein
LSTRSISTPLEIVAPLEPQLVELWLWPNRLTLEAPSVAVLWQLLLAHCLHIRLNAFAPWALGLAVWFIYVVDHLIDTARPKGINDEPARKEFCRRHWEKFLVMAIVVGCVLAAGVTRFLWTTTIRVGWQISVAVACYFALIHLAPATWRKGWPREVIVAAIFAVGTFGAVWMAIDQRTDLLLAPALMFIALVCTNCSLIETWEWQEGGSLKIDIPNPAARWVAGHLWQVGLFIALSAAVWEWNGSLPPGFAMAVSLSGLALIGLARFRQKIPIRFVSLAADLALCSPLVVIACDWAFRH